MLVEIVLAAPSPARGTEENLSSAAEAGAATGNGGSVGAAEGSAFGLIGVGRIVTAVLGAAVAACPVNVGSGIGLPALATWVTSGDAALKSSNRCGAKSGCCTVPACVPTVRMLSDIPGTEREFFPLAGSEPGKPFSKSSPTAPTVPSAFAAAMLTSASGNGTTAKRARSAGFAAAGTAGGGAASSAPEANEILESLLPEIFFPPASLLTAAVAAPNIDSVSAAPKSPLARADEVSPPPAFCRTCELRRPAACILSPQDSGCTRLANVRGCATPREAGRHERRFNHL